MLTYFKQGDVMVLEDPIKAALLNKCMEKYLAHLAHNYPGYAEANRELEAQGLKNVYQIKDDTVWDKLSPEARNLFELKARVYEEVHRNISKLTTPVTKRSD